MRKILGFLAFIITSQCNSFSLRPSLMNTHTRFRDDMLRKSPRISLQSAAMNTPVDFGEFLSLPSTKSSISLLRSSHPPNTSSPAAAFNKIDDVFYGRFVMEHTKDDNLNFEKASQALKNTLEFRNSPEGEVIIKAAATAIHSAYSGNEFNNDPILSAAPYSEKVTKFVTAESSITQRISDNLLLYIIKAGKIDDKKLMKEVTVDELTAFYLYAKEVQFQLADAKTRETGFLSQVSTLNDLSGINLFSSSEFRDVLSAVSKRSATYYPMLSKTTFLANLPKILLQLVKLFTPLFPPSVRAKLQFISVEVPELVTLKNSPFLADFERTFLN